MTKKIISTGIAIGAMFMFSGCGSDSDIPDVPTGTAFYIDSAVSGVNYTCGSTEGITGSEGEFTFELGESCTFYLGDIELRAVDAGLLVDGESVYETDVKIARILQSLDSDGDPSNGITLDTDIIEALAEAGIDALPETVEEMDAMIEIIVDNDGAVVSEEDAQAHLDETEAEAIAAGDIPAPVEPTLAELIIGKTVYNECNGLVMQMTFGADGVIRSIEDGQSFAVDYRIDGNILYTTEEEGEKAHTFVEITSEVLIFTEEEGGTTTFYFTAAAAAANPSTDCEGEDEGPFNFTTDWLNGRSLFYVQYDDFGYDDMKWNMARMDFLVNTFNWTEYDTADTGTHAFTYSVNSDGNIVYYYGTESGDTQMISSPEMTEDYIKVCQDGDCNTYLFFDEGKARDFRDSQN